MADVLPFRTPTPLEREAIAELSACLGSPHGSINGTPYADLDRRGRLQLLEMSVEWGDYIGRGLHPDTPPLLMSNAVDGKPPERWLERTPAEREERAAELAETEAAFAAACDRIDRPAQDRHGIEAAVAALETGWLEERLVLERGPEERLFDAWLAELARNAPQTTNDRGLER